MSFVSLLWDTEMRLEELVLDILKLNIKIVESNQACTMLDVSQKKTLCHGGKIGVQ